MHVIVGTAGHIDHGKTALVKALTGTDADRLPEEKRRGITVDLGFAEMSVDDAHFGFVDVPGHERFVKNMLAGASGIDIVLLVIAANEGVMPQTREHFDICRLLGIKSGVVALTKSDLADAETLDLAKLDAAELVANSFLENAPVIAVSSKHGDGIDELKQALVGVSRRLTARQDRLVTRLPIDRSFSMRGFGAVVTGTLASGEINEGDELELLPDGRRTRVRGLQSHGRATKTAHAGQRVAVNLAGVNHDEITRGMSLTEPNTLQPTQIVDAEIEVLPAIAKPLRTRQRVRVHIGTAEVLARIQVLNTSAEITPGASDLAQIRFETPVVAVPGERFIIRSYSPQITIAGGRVIDTAAKKHRQRDYESRRSWLRSFIEEDDAARIRLLVEAEGVHTTTFSALQSRTGLKTQVLEEAIRSNVTRGAIIDAGGNFIERNSFERLTEATSTAVAEFHKREPLAKGMPLDALREKIFSRLPDAVFRSVLQRLATDAKIVVEKELARKPGQRVELSKAESEFVEKLRSDFKRAGLEVAKLDEMIAGARTATSVDLANARKLFQLLVNSSEIIKVTDDFYFSAEAIDALKSKLAQFADATSDRLIDVAKFKEIAGVSRKYAIPLLEYLDSVKVTVRSGDKRLII